MARPGSPPSTSRNACTENVEKVVKPPRNPTPEGRPCLGRSPVRDDDEPQKERAEHVDRNGHPRERVAMEAGGDAVAKENPAGTRQGDQENRHGRISSNQQAALSGIGPCTGTASL